MKSSVPFLESHVDPWVKLQMFKSLPRYMIIEFTVVRLKEEPYYRSFSKIADKEQKLYFEGMAEGHAAPIAKLRALAEAYERSCLRAYFGSSIDRIGGGYPYGAGVGLSKKAATKRAYGEYLERSLIGAINMGSHACELLTKQLNSPVGPLFVSIMKNGSGSGYGCTKRDSEDSALRSALRKRDFSERLSTFLRVTEPPQILRITPKQGGWLECFYVGH